jgi:hypothetical protein
LETAPEPPRAHWPAMPAALERIILRCLEKDPARRHPRIEQLLAELDALRSEAPAAPHAAPGMAGSPLAAKEAASADPARHDRSRMRPVH